VKFVEAADDDGSAVRRPHAGGDRRVDTHHRYRLAAGYVRGQQAGARLDRRGDALAPLVGVADVQRPPGHAGQRVDLQRAAVSDPVQQLAADRRGVGAQAALVGQDLVDQAEQQWPPAGLGYQGVDQFRGQGRQVGGQHRPGLVVGHVIDPDGDVRPAGQREGACRDQPHAERRPIDLGEQAMAQLNERPLGVFSRQLFLGDALDTEHIDAAYSNGVLVLRIPIAEKAKPRKIAVTGPEQSEQKVITG
jgi:hypothetical protein